MDESQTILIVFVVATVVVVPLFLMYMRSSEKNASAFHQKLKDRKAQIWQSWAQSKGLTFHPALGNATRDEAHADLNSDFLNPQGFKKMVTGSLTLMSEKFDRFKDKVKQYFAGEPFQNDTYEPIVTGQLLGYPIVFGSELVSMGESSQMCQYVCLNYPTPPEKWDRKHCLKTEAQKPRFAEIERQIRDLGVTLHVKPGMIQFISPEIKSPAYLDRLYHLAQAMITFLDSAPSPAAE